MRLKDERKIKFVIDEDGRPRAIVKDKQKYELFSILLESDVHSPTRCRDVLGIISDIESRSLDKYEGIGDTILLKLSKEEAVVQSGIPISKDSLDFGDSNKMSLYELKLLLEAWLDYLEKSM